MGISGLEGDEELAREYEADYDLSVGQFSNLCERGAK